MLINITYNKEQFENAKSRELIPCKCPTCSKIFYRPKNYIQQKIKKNVKQLYCSNSCSSSKPEIYYNTNCEQCGKEIIQTESQLKRSKHHFCSQSCAAKYRNAHKTTGYRRSKLEIYLENRLTELYPDLEIIYNDHNILDGLELDIYVPSMKLAFELNGIFHYIPAFGHEQLEKIQDRDYRKLQRCHELGINVCVIDVSSQKRFTEESCKKYLDIVKSFII